MELMIIEVKTFEKLKERIRQLSNEIENFREKLKVKEKNKWLDSQDVCLALDISKRSLQLNRDNGTIPYTSLGGKFYYKETDIDEILKNGLKV